MITLEPEKENQFICGATIKVIGLGGAGGNTVNSIIESGPQGFECIVANTDAQALELSKADKRIQIGVKSTKGLGTGADPEMGRRAAEEDLDKVLEAIGDADIVFLAAGMGGGTGSGATPVIARALREKGILSIAIVTKPFLFEGKKRAQVAEDSLEELRKEVDTIIVIPNQKLLDLVDTNVSMIDAFGMINEVLGQSVRGISDIITKPGHINVDFADVRAIMRDRGMAVMGTGKASGPDRACKAAQNAVSSPLLENITIRGAHGVLLNITGGKNLSLHEISEAASVIYEQAHEDANIILGSVIDESLEDEVVVTIIATGCERDMSSRSKDEPTHTSENDASGIQIRATIVDRSEERIVPESHIEPKEDRQEKNEDVEKLSIEELVEDHAEAKEAKIADEPVSKLSSETQKKSKQVDLNDLDVPAYLRKQGRQEAE